MTEPSAFRTLDDADLNGKRVLVRVDLNVPMDDGRVSDDTRIEAVLPTIREISDKGGKVILLAHFGRPKGVDDALSLITIAPEVASRLGRPVGFVSTTIGKEAHDAVAAMKHGDVLLLENTRFDPREEKNDPALIEALAKLGDFYVNDAFATAHRAHASTEGLAHHLPAFAGRCMQVEIEALAKALEKPERPVMAVVGGAKVSSKLELLGNLVAKVDLLVIGGGMANTFLAARGVDVGKSLCEHDLAETALSILDAADRAGCTVHLPYDVVVAKEFRANPPTRTINVHEVEPDEMILDCGPAASEAISDALKTCRTLVWNGPLGAFEMQPFDTATMALAHTTAALTKSGSLVSVAGGGDTVAAVNVAGVAGDLTFVSTAGGAFLEWMEGKDLPGVRALQG